jgi:ribonuclease HI
MKINIYTDGSAKGNPGKGGFGVVLISGKHYKEISQGFRHTTNNRMELLAVIVGLEHLKNINSEVQVYSDSKYVVDSIEKKWVFQWEKKHFKGKKNADLWKRFLIIYKKHKVSFNWVKGHAGHPQNEKCDYLAVEASEQSQLLVDEGYESSNGTNTIF